MWTGSAEVSIERIVRTPLFFASSDCQNAAGSWPIGLSTPIPVITTRRGGGAAMTVLQDGGGTTQQPARGSELARSRLRQFYCAGGLWDASFDIPKRCLSSPEKTKLRSPKICCDRD